MFVLFGFRTVLEKEGNCDFVNIAEKMSEALFYVMQCSIPLG